MQPHKPLSEEIEPWWLEGAEEYTEDLSSKMFLEVEDDIECRLGETGLDVLFGDPDADSTGGEPWGVSRGELVWNATRRPGAIRGRMPTRKK